MQALPQHSPSLAQASPSAVHAGGGAGAVHDVLPKPSATHVSPSQQSAFTEQELPAPRHWTHVPPLHRLLQHKESLLHVMPASAHAHL